MLARFARTFRCPTCTAPVAVTRVTSQEVDDVLEGQLACDRGHFFPIAGGIPRFRIDNGYAANFGEQWNRFRRTQIDKFNGTTLSRDRFYSGTGWSPADLCGADVLEVGCGAGRFTQVLLDAGAHVCSVDYSNAVDACLANSGPTPTLCLSQGDVYSLPFEPASFDFVFCYGVLQHTPDPRAAFLALASSVKPNGRLAIDVYRKAWELQPYKSKYLWRPLTTRMSRGRLLRIIEWYVPRWLPIDTVIKKTPVIGRLAGMLIPCWNYDALPLTKQMKVEWAILDTFDALAPAYDLPQTVGTVREWFREAGFPECDVRIGGNGVLGNGRRAGAVRDVA